MKSFGQLSEDLETRRQELKQSQREQAAKFKEKGAAAVDAQKQRMQAAQERIAADKARDEAEKQAREDAKNEAEARRQEKEEIKNELRAELEQKKERKREQDKKRMSKERAQVTPDSVG